MNEQGKQSGERMPFTWADSFKRNPHRTFAIYPFNWRFGRGMWAEKQLNGGGARLRWTQFGPFCIWTRETWVDAQPLSWNQMAELGNRNQPECKRRRATQPLTPDSVVECTDT